MTCSKAGIFIDFRGRVIADHFPDSNWRIEEFFGFLKRNNVSWRRIFWKVWGRLNNDEWKEWCQKFVYAEKDHCTYHPNQPQFVYGSNTGSYPCWEADAVRFTTGVNTGGCKNKSHIFTDLKPDSLNYLFLNKHYELLKEPVQSDLPVQSIKEEELNEELWTEDSKAIIPVIKHKLMSLLWLVKEFTKTKRSKGRNINCSECIKLNSWWNEWLMMEDEDDDTPDFNFVLPKKLKPSSISKFEIWNL